METLNSKVALITGGSKGIGFGVADALLTVGMNVAITSRSEDSAIEAAKKLSSPGRGKVLGLVADVRDYESMRDAVGVVMEKFGHLDLVVANAGIGHFGSIADLSVEKWKQTIDTNLSGVFYTVKAAVEALKESQGYIITISSLAGTNFFEGGAAYNASKFGVTGMSQAIMLDLRKYGIKVSTIMPGSVATHFNDHEPSDKDSWKIQKEDIGQLVVDLLKMNPRTLPSKIEVRPTQPPQKS